MRHASMIPQPFSKNSSIIHLLDSKIAMIHQNFINKASLLHQSWIPRFIYESKIAINHHEFIKKDKEIRIFVISVTSKWSCGVGAVHILLKCIETYLFLFKESFFFK